VDGLEANGQRGESISAGRGTISDFEVGIFVEVAQLADEPDQTLAAASAVFSGELSSVGRFSNVGFDDCVLGILLAV
jgi:hypothetical protein